MRLIKLHALAELLPVKQRKLQTKFQSLRYQSAVKRF
jgi:hypothetical protein